MRDPWQITDYRIGKVILLHVIDRFDTAASGAPENPSESRGDGAEPSRQQRWPRHRGHRARQAGCPDGQLHGQDASPRDGRTAGAGAL